MLDIIIHQGNLNQSHNEMHFTLTRTVKIKEIVRIGDEAVEKSERPCAGDGKLKCSYFGRQYGITQKIKHSVMKIPKKDAYVYPTVSVS